MSKSPKKFLKRIFWTLSVLIVLVVLAGISLAYIYEAEVKQYAVEKINEQTNSKIKVEKIELSFLKRFPMAALQFHNVEVMEALKNGEGGSLLKAEDVFLKFDVIDLLQNKIVLKDVEINNSKLNLTVFKDGSDNFHILKKQDTTESKYLLEFVSLSLNNAAIWYHNYATKQEMDLLIHSSSLSGIFAEQQFNVNIISDILIQKYSSEGYQMFSKKALSTDINIVINAKTGQFDVKKGAVIFNKIPVMVSGSIEKPREGVLLNLQIKADKLSLNQIVNTIPQAFSSGLENYNFKGLLSIDADVNGLIVSRSTPQIKVRISLANAMIESLLYDAKLKNINIQAVYSNGKSHSLSSSTVQVKNLSFEMKDSKFHAKAKLNNFIKTKVNAELNGDLNLDELIKFTGKVFGIQKLKGLAAMKLQIAGNIVGLIDDKPLDFSGLDYQASIKMKGASFKHKASNVYYENIVGRMSINANNIHIDPTFVSINGHRHQVQGDVKNYRKWSNDSQNQKLYISGNAQVSQFSYHDIEQIIGANDEGDGTFPKDIDIQLRFKADSFYWDNLLARNATGIFIMRNQMLSVKQAQFISFGGHVQGQFSLNGNNASTHPFVCNGVLKNIIITQAFNDFNDFDQKVITAQNIKGKLSATFTFNARFDKNWKLDKPSLNLESDVKIVNGELNNIKELDALSSYTRIDDFSHIVFSTIENSIQIQNEKIMIPDMVVTSNKMDIDLAGIHDFNNNYDYHIGVLLSDVLFKKAKAESENEFGEVESDGYGKTKLFFHVFGDANDLHVKYDSKSLQKKLKKDMKEDGNDLKKALNEEFGWFKKAQASAKKDSVKNAKNNKKQEKLDLKKQEEGEFIFEWDEGEDETDDPQEL